LSPNRGCGLADPRPADHGTFSAKSERGSCSSGKFQSGESDAGKQCIGVLMQVARTQSVYDMSKILMLGARARLFLQGFVPRGDLGIGKIR
jgi:hypothetical protein